MSHLVSSGVGVTVKIYVYLGVSYLCRWDEQELFKNVNSCCRCVL